MVDTVADIAAPKDKGTRRVNPYEVFEPEIMTKIIGPKLVPLIQAGGHGSKAGLLTSFNTAYECDVSMSAFSRWLDLLGIGTQRQSVSFTLPEGLAQPAAPVNDLPSGVHETTPPISAQAAARTHPATRNQPAPGAGGIVPQ